MSITLNITSCAAEYYICGSLIHSVAIDPFYFDTDRVLRFRLLAAGATAAQIVAGTAIPEDASTYQLSWTLRKKWNSVTAEIEKTTGSGITVVGVFNIDPLLNTQWIEVTIEDSDTYDPLASPAVYVKPGTYVHALKRTDVGSEDIKARGSFVILPSAGWE